MKIWKQIRNTCYITENCGECKYKALCRSYLLGDAFPDQWGKYSAPSDEMLKILFKMFNISEESKK